MPCAMCTTTLRKALPRSHQVPSRRITRKCSQRQRKQKISLCTYVHQCQNTVRLASDLNHVNVEEAHCRGRTWTLGEARWPPCDGCTCLSLTLTCVDRPAELRSVVACRSTSSSDSFLTPTFLTVPFPASLELLYTNLFTVSAQSFSLKLGAIACLDMQGCHGVQKRMTCARSRSVKQRVLARGTTISSRNHKTHYILPSGRDDARAAVLLRR